MKKVKLIVLMMLCVQLNSCTSEPDLYTFTTRIKNNSTSTIEVKGFNIPRDLVYDEIIQSNNSSSNCTESSETFLGLGCRIDSLVVRFDNGKGYVTTALGVNSISFVNRNPLLGNKLHFKNLGNNTFEFEITQEDYDNAYDLP